MQPASAAVVLVAGIVLAVLNIAGIGVWMLLLAIIWAANVGLGGGFNEPMWHLPGRVQRLIQDPRSFTHEQV